MKLLKYLILLSFALLLSGLAIARAEGRQKMNRSDKTIKIGLLIPFENSMAARQGAELAILKANENGGLNGNQFQLVLRSMEGSWGTGSKQAVDLIFKEKVCAIMGSPDGRNGHLIEQASVKTKIVFLSTWASDPTLAQAFVPWYFTCVPNDIQQADALIEVIYNQNHYSKIAAVSDNSYDSKLAINNFSKRTKASGKKDPVQIYYDNGNHDFQALIDQIISADVSCVILFGNPSASVKINQLLSEKAKNIPVFGTLSLLNEDELKNENIKTFENVLFTASGNWSEQKGLVFRDNYRKTYGKLPGAVAAYSYDGMGLLIEAIRIAGSDREEIQKTLAKIHYDGVTGPIRFDDKGKRTGSVGLMKFKNGSPVMVER
jgi:branched-chain amino acid transport system substrate-binding protein